MKITAFIITHFDLLRNIYTQLDQYRGTVVPVETSILREQGNSIFSSCLTQYQMKNIDPSISGSQKLSRARVVLCCLQKTSLFGRPGASKLAVARHPRPSRRLVQDMEY